MIIVKPTRRQIPNNIIVGKAQTGSENQLGGELMKLRKIVLIKP